MRSLISQWSRAWAQRGRPPSSPFQSVMARKRMENSNRNAEYFTNLQDTLDKKPMYNDNWWWIELSDLHTISIHIQICAHFPSAYTMAPCVWFFFVVEILHSTEISRLTWKKNQRCLLYSTAWKLCCENTQASKCILKSIFCHKFDLLVICLKVRI